MDELTRIERQYGSVAEYNRCVEEEEARYLEQSQQIYSRHDKNQKHINKYYYKEGNEEA